MDRIAEDWEKDKKENPSINFGNRPRDGFNSGGYTWCLDNWGTEWWASEVEYCRYKSALSYSFDTAWSPPIPVIKKLIKDFPKLKISIEFEEESKRTNRGSFRGKGDMSQKFIEFMEFIDNANLEQLDDAFHEFGDWDGYEVEQECVIVDGLFEYVRVLLEKS